MAAPLENFEGEFEASVTEPVAEISDELLARRALSTYFGGIEVVGVWARIPFKEYRGEEQIGGAMEAVCRVRDGDEIGTRTLWFEGNQPAAGEKPIDFRTRAYLGQLADAHWRDPQTQKFCRDYGGESGHYRIIQGAIRS